MSTATWRRHLTVKLDEYRYLLLIPYPNLKYAQVCKQKEKGKVVEGLQRAVFGDLDEVMRPIGVDSGGKINTAYIERLNLTIRNSLARFVRRGINCSKYIRMHSYAIDFFLGLVQLRQTTPI